MVEDGAEELNRQGPAVDTESLEVGKGHEAIVRTTIRNLVDDPSLCFSRSSSVRNLILPNLLRQMPSRCYAVTLLAYSRYHPASSDCCA